MKKIRKLLLMSAVSVLGLSSVGLNTVMGQGTSVDSRETIATVEISDQGALKIANEPKPLVFKNEENENQTVSFEEVTLYSAEQTEIIVSDFRSNNSDGWELSAQLSTFRLESDETVETLEGALINFNSLVPNNKNSFYNVAPSVQNPFSLTSGAASNYVAYADRTSELADPEAGVGPWGIQANITLTIPEYKSSAGNHKSKIIWELKNAH